jgi:hypothetical protein
LVVAAALALTTGALAGCGAYYDTGAYPEAVEPAPPDPLVEEIPPPPAAAYVWVPGYWYWGGNTYLWSAGYYAMPPAPGHRYVRSGWVHVDGRYRFVRGYWAPRAHRVPYRYVHKRVKPRQGPAYRTYLAPRRHGHAHPRPR